MIDCMQCMLNPGSAGIASRCGYVSLTILAMGPTPAAFTPLLANEHLHSIFVALPACICTGYTCRRDYASSISCVYIILL